MTVDKGTYIAQVRPGQIVSGLFCVASKSVRQTKTGAAFISMTLMDNSGSIEARVWDRVRELEGLFEKGDIIHIQAEVVEFNGQCQFKVNDLSALGADKRVDPAMFLPVAPIDLDGAWKQCEKAISRIENPEFKRVLEELFSEPETREAFCQAPAAKKMHHAYIGGLLEHSLNVLRLSEQICRLYVQLDKDLMIAASICHDIGKIREFSWHRPPIDYTDQGRLLGHIVMGIQMLEKAIDTSRLNPGSRNLLALKHVILSHHGQKEFGSPVLPMTEEALVFHMIDDLDAKLNFLNSLKKEDGEPSWTDFQRLFERYFFLRPQEVKAGERHVGVGSGGHSANTDGNISGGDESKPSQARLWDDLTKLDRQD